MSTTSLEPRVVESFPPAPGPVIETRELTKRYGDVVALDRLDLAVPAGTVLGLLGPNGAGKTTAVRILCTVISADAGSARVLGMEVAARPDEVRAAIGLAGRYAAVDPVLTGRENLTLIGWLTHLPRRERRARADELLERFGLAEAADRPARTYSGGMRRRLDPVREPTLDDVFLSLTGRTAEAEEESSVHAVAARIPPPSWSSSSSRSARFAYPLARRP